MKKTKFWSFVAVAAMSILTLSSFKGQEVSVSESQNLTSSDTISSDDFPEKEMALAEWLGRNITYPIKCQKEKIQGPVIVNFTLKKNGKISKVETIYSQHPALEEEALRVVKSMAQREDVMNIGIPVGVPYELPIWFEIPRQNPQTPYQVNRPAHFSIMPADTTSVSSDKAIVSYDENASFRGGETALMDWLSSNLQYPPKCQEQGVQGQVIVSYVVEKDGSLTDLQVVWSKVPELTEEALRVMKLMPKWVPAKHNGKPVRSRFNLPIRFRLG